MKIRCNKIIDENSGAEMDSSSWLTVGNIYLVLCVFYDWAGNLKYRILGNDKSTPALHDARQFEIVSGVLPPNWIAVANSGSFFELAPAPWTKSGFWKEYFDQNPNAIEIFEEERRKIIAADP